MMKFSRADRSVPCSLALLALLGLALLVPSARAASYTYGEFIPTSRRGQFMGFRTQWHEQLGKHCPTFGKDRLVLMPIPQPSEFKKVDEYKLSLDFDGGRYLTPWVTIMGRGVPHVPLLKVTLRYTGDEIRQVKAEVTEATGMVLQQYAHVRAEFANPNHWPKHLLVLYLWEDTREFDVDTGLYLAFTVGFAVTIIVAVRVVSQYRGKLADFFAEVMPEDTSVAAAAAAAYQAAPGVAAMTGGAVPGMGGWAGAAGYQGPKKD